ncbi:MAG: hypothetical protein LAP85_03565 [Acidobacteriia bacterium]|nr:hypothetical protein [Terriglobia bacterium]
MRISDSISYRSLLDNLNMLNERAEQANEEVSSGKRLNHLHIAPADSAEMVKLNDQLSQLDQYQTNADNSGFFLQVSESTLNSIYNLVTSIFTRGSAAANGPNDANTLATLAADIRSQRDQIFSLANTQVRGRYIFAGSSVTTPAFSITGDTVTYLGNADVNTIDISNGLKVNQNIPGAAVLAPVFNTVETLLTAIGSGNQTAIQSALAGFSGALATLGRVRTSLGVDLSKLQDAALARQTQETDIKTRQSHIGDANMAEAISRLSQTQTAMQAALTAGSLIHQKNLFDFLG